MASIENKYWLWPGIFVLYRAVTDRQDGLCWYDRLTRLYERSTESFIVSAAEADKNKEVKKTYPPTFPLPEFAEYSRDLGCDVSPKRKRMFVAHMFCNTNKRALDAHRDNLCKYMIDPNAEFVVCPSVAYLDYVDKTFPQCVKLGVQNIYPKDEGNYTGEVSLPMVKEMGASYVLIGTRHRRRYLGESQKFVKMKIKESLRHGMKCIVFINAVNGPYDDCSLKLSVGDQLRAVLCSIDADDWPNISLACEAPPSPLGKDESVAKRACTAQRICGMVRQMVSNKVGDDIGNRIQILYAGDICHSSAPTFMSKKDIDGLVFCPKDRGECFVNIVNSGLLLDQRNGIWPPEEEPEDKKKKKDKKKSKGNEEEEEKCVTRSEMKEGEKDDEEKKKQNSEESSKKKK